MPKNKNELEIYAKESYCLLSIPLKNNEKFVWIADRKPSENPEIKYFDSGLINFFEENKTIKFVGISGHLGKEFVSKNLAKNAKIKIRELSFPEQRALENKYLSGKYISQIQPG
jgi:hypothetical protein